MSAAPGNLDNTFSRSQDADGVRAPSAAAAPTARRSTAAAPRTPPPMAGKTQEAIAHDVHDQLRSGIADPTVSAVLDGTPHAEWTLVTQGKLGETDILSAYTAVTELPQAEDEEFENIEVVPDITHDFLSEHGCVPLVWADGQSVLAVYHPYSIGKVAYQWRAMFGHTPEFKLGRRSLVEHALTNFYAVAKREEDQIDWTADTSEQALKDLAHEAPVVRLVNDMFNRAVELGASDIHVEPSENELTIRYRVDGILHTVLNPPLSYYAAIASRLKLIANMNIAERRLPQDGRIDLNIGGTRLDVRVSTVPSMHGESIVLRLLQKDTSMFDLDNLGLGDHTLDRFKTIVQRPYGMVLVVGPTGSGKTTTLYGVMKMLNSEKSKIITIEDPVEYQISGLTQIQVRPQIGLSFANGLRSIVRQDPDIILVGEIRDRETAEIAIHAALTGHLVFSTLHTNDAAGAVSRLLEMGMEGFLISSALLGVLSQRLVRSLCKDCGGTGTDETNEQHRTCRRCSGTGYRGRTGIFELLVVNDELRTAINERRDSTEIARMARRADMRSLREDGERKIQAGVTTAAEVTRVCQLDIEE